MQCAGNRRSELSKAKTVRGLGWGHAAISTATWKGVKLRDVLLYAGYRPDGGVRHIEFEGLDKDMAGEDVLFVCSAVTIINIIYLVLI